MSQAGYTPIQLYYSTTAAATPSAGNLAAGELAVNITDGKLFYKDNGGVVRVLATAAGSAGDVVGPGSSTDNALVRFDGTTGKLVQNSAGVLDDSGNLTGIAALTTSGALTLNGGTANGVAYLNGSKVLTTGSALTFDGTNLGFGTSSVGSLGTGIPTFQLSGTSGSFPLRSGGASFVTQDGTSGKHYDYFDAGVMWHQTVTNTPQAWMINNAEQMRLTSTGLGIGTSSPTDRLNVGGFSGNNVITIGAATTGVSSVYFGDGTGADRYRGYIDYEHTNDRFVLGTAGTSKATLDTSGNLGLGVTPSAWASTHKALQMTWSAFSTDAGNGETSVSTNAFASAASTWNYRSTAPASRYTQDYYGKHIWFTAPSGTAGNAISFTQAMTLDASGNLALGLTSASSRLHVQGSGEIAIIGSSAQSLYFRPDSSGTMISTGAGQSGVGIYYGSTSNFMYFMTNNTERARIDSSGNLLVGKASPGLTSLGWSFYPNGNADSVFTMAGTNEIFIWNNTSTAGTAIVSFRAGNISKGQISWNNTSTTYTTTSDYRLKEDIQPMTGALAKVQALKPCTYKWKADGSDGEGFIAHELQEVCPDAVTGEKDAVDAEGKPVYQGIDTSFLVATLTAALQEAVAEITQLKARLDAANL